MNIAAVDGLWKTFPALGTSINADWDQIPPSKIFFER